MQDRIDHAKAYPFPAPDHCFEYRRGSWRRLDHDRFDRSGRLPVLAAGSNRSPQQLRRKYGDLPDLGPIPAQRVRLYDFDVVYAAHLTAYGSVPATFQHAPGTAVVVFVLWLNEAQLARMHETEGNYSFDHLAGLRIEADAGGTLAEAYAYTSRRGCLNHGGACVGLAAIPAQGRRFPALSQVEMLGAVRDRLAPGVAVDDFLAQHLADPAVHAARSQALGADALPVRYVRRTIATL